MVTSVAFNSIQVWGIRYFSDIEKIQTTFYKKLLLLPKCTPGYGVRMETNSSHLLVRIFKLILNWIEKILEMSQERYPRISFERLRNLSMRKSTNLKFNWASQIDIMFERLGGKEDWHQLTLNSLQRNKMARSV